MEDKKDKVAAEMGNSLYEQFYPAGSIDDATHRWTTTEISLAIQQHTGTSVTNEDLYEVLRKNGFNYVVDNTVQNTKFVWLLKMK